MKINIDWYWNIPSQIPTNVVVIDAYAATTDVSIILANKPRRFLIVNEQNYELAAKTYPGSILVGESDILPPDKFLTNIEPKNIKSLTFKDKDVLWMSINGSRVFEKFKNAPVLLSCAFNNIDAIMHYINKQNYSEIWFALAGNRGEWVEEDAQCAQLLKEKLDKQFFDLEVISQKMYEFMSSYPHYGKEYEENFNHVVAFNAFPVVPQCFINDQGFPQFKEII